MKLYTRRDHFKEPSRDSFMSDFDNFKRLLLIAFREEFVKLLVSCLFRYEVIRSKKSPGGNVPQHRLLLVSFTGQSPPKLDEFLHQFVPLVKVTDIFWVDVVTNSFKCLSVLILHRNVKDDRVLLLIKQFYPVIQLLIKRGRVKQFSVN